jgi:hypothetical protein
VPQSIDEADEDREKALLAAQSLQKFTLIGMDPGGLNTNATGSPEQSEASWHNSRNMEEAPKTEKARRYKSNTSSIFGGGFPKIARWSKTREAIRDWAIAYARAGNVSLCQSNALSVRYLVTRVLVDLPRY